VKERTKEAIMREVNIYTEKKFDLWGATVTKAENGTKYDYSVSNDAVYNDLAAEMEALKEKIKARQAIIKAAPKTGLEITNPETGELMKVYPPIKSSESFIKVELK